MLLEQIKRDETTHAIKSIKPVLRSLDLRSQFTNSYRTLRLLIIIIPSTLLSTIFLIQINLKLSPTLLAPTSPSAPELEAGEFETSTV